MEKLLQNAKSKSKSRLHSVAIKQIRRFERSNRDLVANSPDFQRLKSEIFMEAYDDPSVCTNDSYLEAALESAQNLVRLLPNCKSSSLFLIKLMFNHTGGESDVQSFMSVLKECDRIDPVLKIEAHDDVTRDIVKFRENAKRLINLYIEKISLLALWAIEDSKFDEAIQIMRRTSDALPDWGFVHRFLAGIYEELAFGTAGKEEKQIYLDSAYDSASKAVAACPKSIEYMCFFIAVGFMRDNHDIGNILYQINCLDEIVEDSSCCNSKLIDNWLGLSDPNRYTGLIFELRSRIFLDVVSADVHFENPFRPFAKINDWADQENANVQRVCSQLHTKRSFTSERSIVRTFSPTNNVELENLKLRVAGLWNRLGIDGKRRFLKTTPNDLLRNLEFEDFKFVYEVCKFGKETKSWKFYSCFYNGCEMKSLGEESYLQHIGIHMARKDRDFLIKLHEKMPQSVSPGWLSYITDGQWEPIDFKAIMSAQNTTSTEIFIEREDLWPRVKDPVRASLLQIVQDLLESLYDVDLLTEGHLHSMINYSITKLSAEPSELCWTRSHFLYCCLDSSALREMINALVQLFETCSTTAERSDQSLVNGFNNRGITLAIDGEQKVEFTLKESASGHGRIDFLDIICSGPSFKELLEWWRSLREDRNVHSETLVRVLTGVYIHYIEMQLINKTERHYDIFTLNDTDALLNKTHIAVQELMHMIIDTAEDSYEELLLALVKSHIQELLRKASLDSV